MERLKVKGKKKEKEKKHIFKYRTKERKGLLMKYKI